MASRDTLPASVASHEGTVRILHVEDDSEFADLASFCLEREDDSLEVVTENSADDGLDTLRETAVDCIVSDYQMPGKDGLEFLEAVREDHPDLPFILFTGKGSEEIASQAISAGVTDYLQKEGGTDQFTVLANRIRNAVDRAEAERQVEQGFHAMETAREGISILDEEGYFRYANEKYSDIVGYDRENLVGEHWEMLYPDEHVDRVREEILPAIPTEGRWTGETVYVREDGERILVDHALSFCGDGSIICLIKEMTGENGEEETDGPFVAEEAFIEGTLDALDDVFYVLDTEGNIVRTNDKATEVTGYSRDELTSATALDVVAPEDRDAVEADFQTALETGHARIEASLLTKEGERLPYEFRKRRLTDSEGNAVGVVGIGRDISERERREHQLERQAKQFESFASVLSHDLRSPLDAAGTRLELARETGEDEHFEAAESALDRLDALIDDLAEAMQEGRLTNERTAVDIAALANSCWETLGREDASLTVRETRPVRADEGALTRLLENLLRNAVEHGGEGVTVRIGMLPDGFYVAEDGPGIPEDEREEVFEPGYTTKEEGSGLGMASVQQIAMAHGWGVDVTDSDEGGARFEFTDVEFAE